jgi:pyridoxal 5'-phosphate synthase pdxT subunit
VNAKVGVLALQGAFAAHQIALADRGVETRQVRVAADLEGLNGLVIPGGESTTMSNLLLRAGMFEAVSRVINSGMHVFGTCAGMIMLAGQVLDGRADQVSFAVMDISVRRNAYGRQVDSFETELQVEGLNSNFHAVFIRAPKVEHCGSEVQILASYEDSPVLIRQGNLMAASFHPELSNDSRIHELFIEQILKSPMKVSK